jgi:predicted O-methyltransferase YrrM
MEAQETLWRRVDEYLNGLLIGHDAALEEALRDSARASLPAINVAPNQGKLLHLLARSINARRILEIGTLGGYSTIWLARALPPDGTVVTLEYEQKHADVARRNIERAGLKDRVELMVGRALQLLPAIHARRDQPFDLVFIDADKPSNPGYFEWALKLTRPGSLIIIDNVVRKGAVIDGSSTDASILGTRQCMEMISREPRVSATAFQTVGSKEYDGMLIALVTA